MFDLFCLHKRLLSNAALVAAVFVQLSFSTPLVTAQTRSLGLDISAWQGSISPATWSTFHNVDNRDFVFLRSSRGGTTGFYNQSNSSNTNPPGQNTLSQRYDDPYFAQNITYATAAGLFAGSYHFARADIIASTPYAGGIANTGADEANHFIEMAGAWMRPGYLLPVLDLEAGNSQHSKTSLSNFAVEFSDRIYSVTGFRPAIYANSSYANSEVNSSVAASMPKLWIARPTSGNPLTSEPPPATSYPNVYGVWNPSYPTIPSPQPWTFWQYDTTGGIPGYGGNIDKNVANGGIEYVKDQLVPALWTNDSDGEWTSLANWNSGQTPVAPEQGPGQVPSQGRWSLPSVRLPGSNDTVILDRPGANINVTLSSGTHNIRKLYVRESLSMTGGVLNVGYVPTSDSTPISAQFSAPVSLTGPASLSVHTLQVDPFQSLSLEGATLSFATIELMPHSSSPATLQLSGDLNFNPLTSGTATIANGLGSGNSGRIDLGGANRVFNIADGAANIDLAIEVPILNGSLTKTGPGTLTLLGNNSLSGDSVVQEGVLTLHQAILPDGSDVLLSTGGILNLDFSGTPDIIGKFSIDGNSLPIGTWGALGSGAQFTTPLITGTGFLQVTSTAIPGDFDNDNDVDGNDLTAWQNAYGNGAGGDADEDGDTDGRDLLIWQRNYTGAIPPLATSTAVPEPGTITLLLLTVFSALTVRGKQACE